MSDQFHQKLRPYTRGVGALRLNKLIRAVERLYRGAPIARVAHPGGLASTVVQRFKIQSVVQDALICYWYDGVNVGEQDVYVAKPWALRGSLTEQTIGALAVTFSAYVEPEYQEKTASASGESDETWKVTPDYEPDQEIIGLDVSLLGGTGVEYTGSDMVTRPVFWLDLNQVGRVWALSA